MLVQKNSRNHQDPDSLRGTMERLARNYKTAMHVLGISAGVAQWTAAGLIFVGVVARYVFNYGIIFTAEFATYMTAFICFVGGAYTQWVNGHVNVSLITSRLPNIVQHWILIGRPDFAMSIPMAARCWSATAFAAQSIGRLISRLN